MRELSPTARVYVSFVVVLGVVCAAVVLWGTNPALVAVYIALAMLLEVFRVESPHGVTFSISITVIFLGLLLSGMPGVVAAGIGCGAGGLTTKPRLPLVRALFNAALFAVAATCAGLTFFALGGTAAAIDIVDIVVPFAAAVMVYSTVNLVLLSGVLLLIGRRRIADIPELAVEIIGVQPFYAAPSLVGYVAMIAVHPLALGLVLVPLFMARHSESSAAAEEQTFDRLTTAFAKAIEVKDDYTRGHGERVADLSVRVGRELRLSADELRTIKYGALLHDVGKIGVSIGVLCKNGRLTGDEYDEMKIHPALGAEILRDVDFLAACLPLVRHHHERLDGRGYPDGLAAGDIPMLTRIVTAVDAFDAMTSTRSYRRAMSVPLAITELNVHTGPQFDAGVVAALIRVVERDGWTLTDETVQIVEQSTSPVSDEFAARHAHSHSSMVGSD